MIEGFRDESREKVNMRYSSHIKSRLGPGDQLVSLDRHQFLSSAQIGETSIKKKGSISNMTDLQNTVSAKAGDMINKFNLKSSGVQRDFKSEKNMKDILDLTNKEF